MTVLPINYKARGIETVLQTKIIRINDKGPLKNIKFAR